MSWIDQRPDDAMAGAFEAIGPDPVATVDPKPTLVGAMSTGGRLNVRRLIESLDVVPPDPITGLQVDGVQGDRVTLRWVAPAG